VLGNFGRVIIGPTKLRGNLYRSGQPDADGFNRLRKMGVGLIIKLNETWEFSNEKETLAAFPIGVQAIEVTPWDADSNNWLPNKAIITKTLNDIQRALPTTNVLIHCDQGRDRTGLLIASWRIIKDRWWLMNALLEMIKYGVSGPVAEVNTTMIRFLTTLDLETW
jgi:protein tyrosine/serine phosphatase